MTYPLKPVFLFIASLLLAACASSPFKQEGVDRSITPGMAKATDSHLDKTVLWGGMIIDTRNKQDHSVIEVLAYPLDGDGEPIRTAAVQGRFLVIQNGFLEPAEYAPGRWISVLGKVQPVRTGQVGSSNYVYPVIQSQQLHLWSDTQSREGSDSRIRFGIGIGIHL